MEDEPAVHSFVMSILERAGYECVGAENGEEALRLLQSGMHFDLIVSDIRMPGMDAFSLLEQVKKIHPEVAFVLITGDVANEETMQSLMAFRGAYYGYLEKPFRVPELTELVRRALENGVLDLGSDSTKYGSVQPTSISLSESLPHAQSSAVLPSGPAESGRHVSPSWPKRTDNRALLFGSLHDLKNELAVMVARLHTLLDDNTKTQDANNELASIDRSIARCTSALACILPTVHLSALPSASRGESVLEQPASGLAASVKDIRHEINGALMVIGASLHTLAELYDLFPRTLREIELLRNSVERCSELIRIATVSVGKGDKAEFEQATVDRLVKKLESAVRTRLPERVNFSITAGANIRRLTPRLGLGLLNSVLLEISAGRANHIACR